MLVNIVEPYDDSLEGALVDEGCIHMTHGIFFIPRGLIVSRDTYDDCDVIIVGDSQLIVAVNVIEETETQKYLPLMITSQQIGDSTGRPENHPLNTEPNANFEKDRDWLSRKYKGV